MRTQFLLLTIGRLIGGSKKLDCLSTSHEGADDLAERLVLRRIWSALMTLI